MSVLQNVSIEQQKNSNWCWAAVTASVLQFLRNTVMSQAAIVCKELFNGRCADNPTPPVCNAIFPLEFALQDICGCTVDVRDTLEFADLQAQIDAQRRPVPIRIAFETPQGEVLHYCMVKGCLETAGQREVVVLDPAHADKGQSQMSYDDLRSGAAFGGAWTATLVITGIQGT